MKDRMPTCCRISGLVVLQSLFSSTGETARVVKIVSNDISKAVSKVEEPARVGHVVKKTWRDRKTERESRFLAFLLPGT